ncbi:MAG: PAS domain S-box protein [Candidatus Binatia bacterium]
MSSFIHERLCQQIVEGASEAIIFADREGKIRFWNAGASTIFGYSADEALGQSLDLIIPERQRKRHWEGYEKVMETGVTRYGAELLSVPAMRKDGARISLEFSVVLVRDEAGKSTGVAAIMRDITARWQQEREAKERLAALEQRVATEK